MTNKEFEKTDEGYFGLLAEREFHSDTMKPLTPLEREQLNDWRAHFEPRRAIEAEKEWRRPTQTYWRV